MKLIFNADDFGLSKATNLGILETFRNGPVRSTTMMANMEGFDHAVSLSRENPGLGIGVHLTLTAGNALGGVYKTITDENGAFLKQIAFLDKEKAGEIDAAEVEAEYEQQIQKVLNAGIKLTHFDGHHHTQLLPSTLPVTLKLAKKYGVKLRLYNKEALTGDFAEIVTTGAFTDAFYGEGVTPESLKELISSCKEDSLEIMCHPAFVDYPLSLASSYLVKRTYEAHILTSRDFMDFITSGGYEPVSFAGI